jgi:hypothetical protein
MMLSFIDVAVSCLSKMLLRVLYKMDTFARNFYGGVSCRHNNIAESHCRTRRTNLLLSRTCQIGHKQIYTVYIYSDSMFDT